MLINGCPCLFLKQFTTENTEVTEFYSVNCAAGAVNNTKLFSVSSVTSVVKCLLAVGRPVPTLLDNYGCPCLSFVQNRPGDSINITFI